MSQSQFAVDTGSEQLRTATVLWHDFIAGRQALADPAPPEDEPLLAGEVTRRRARYRERIRSYCHDYLKRLNQYANDPAAQYTRGQIEVGRAACFWELADLLDSYKQGEETEELLLQARASASSSSCPAAIHEGWMRLARFYRSVERFPSAIDCYKQALAHVYPSLVPQIPTILYWMGVTFADWGDLKQAVFMFDWASRFGPEEFKSLVEKQRCRLQLGQREALILESASPYGESCAEVAASVAALQVLGRRQKAVRRAAQTGLELARRTGDQGWERVFQRFAEE